MRRYSLLTVLLIIFVTLDVVRGQKFPYQRYVFYDDLTKEQRGFADLMGYDNNGDEWNLPGSAAIELLSYETIQNTDPSGFAGLTGFQFEEEQWDCYIVSILLSTR